MRETRYDFPYIKSLDEVEMIEGIRSVTYKRGNDHDTFDEYEVVFSDGNKLYSDNQFSLIRMINAYLRYMLNGDVTEVIEN